MTTAVLERPAPTRPSGGGTPARRAVVRWAWRLFRREWRQQLLVLALLVVAVAVTTFGVSLASAATPDPSTKFLLPGTDQGLTADIAAFRQRFGHIEVSTHTKAPVPGSVANVDVRAQDTSAPHPTLRLLKGRYPSGPDEIAITDGVASLLDLQIGNTWTTDGQSARVVGMVENPKDLKDEFIFRTPGAVDPDSTVTIQTNATRSEIESFRAPSHTGLSIESESSGAKSAAAAIVLLLDTMALLFVGLVAVAGFTVMAHRRQRALGMLAAVGATDRHVRLVMLANGAAVGVTAAVTGAALGLVAWLGFGPRIESLVHHRIDRFDLAWWAIGMAMVMAVLTAVLAAWWPARAAARVSVVSALSGRPPKPQPARRFAALGVVLLVIGPGLLALAHQRHPPRIIAGVVSTTFGILFLAPVAIGGLAAAGRRLPIAGRLALRDLARYQSRSGAALGAIALALGIAAAISVSAAAQATADSKGPGNLPANEVVVYAGAVHGGPKAVMAPTDAQLADLQPRINDMATSLHATATIQLEVAVNPNEPDGPAGFGGKQPTSMVRVRPQGRGINEEFVVPLYIATPEVLAHYGIQAAQVDPKADVLSSRTDLAGLAIGDGPNITHNPNIQKVALPRYESDPTTLITEHAVQTLGLQPVSAGWLIQTPQALTKSQISTARATAAAAGLSIETRNVDSGRKQLGTDATAGGIVLALGVLAMTVGLIRSETANDLRTLAATGASSRTRRTLTGATAGAMALLGGLLGTAGAYAALVAWNRSTLHDLRHPPYVNLTLIIAGLPLVAVLAGWLVAGREPAVIARQPLE
jgi:putative ABC transport system permease protein